MIVDINGNQFTSFEQAYIYIRKKEGRILSIEEIIRLPHASQSNPNAEEWKLRIHSTNRLIKYLDKLKPATVLDLACGNGWLTYKLSKIAGHVYGLDVNFTELKLAEQLLKGEDATLIYGDVFEWQAEQTFDIIIINASIQYFEDVSKLVKRLMTRLSPQGEIHILDSPFYPTAKEVMAAKDRSSDYFDQYDAIEMNDYYHHHEWNVLKEFNYELLYNPNTLVNRIKRKLWSVDSPFPWIRIVNTLAHN